jgi:hypothetical protein
VKLKSLAAVVAGALSLVALDASACTTNAWIADGGGTGVNGTPLAAEPDDAIPVPRYSGRCGLLSDAIGDFVRDGSPTAEATYRARFYVRASSDGQQVFRARNAGGTQMIGVTFNAAGFSITTSGGTGTSAPVVANRWYSVELNWAAGQPTSVTIQGNGSSTPLATVNIPASAAGDRIDSADLGWIAGGTGTVGTDAFESRRTTAIGRLCRGDANASNTITAGDRSAVTGEIQGTLATGQPDCNDDGNITAGDRSCITGLIQASATCS